MEASEAYRRFALEVSDAMAKKKEKAAISARQGPAPPSWEESLAFLAHLDSRLGRFWPSVFEDGVPGPFEPLVFLVGDEGSFLSLFDVVVRNYHLLDPDNFHYSDYSHLERLLNRRLLAEHVFKKLADKDRSYQLRELIFVELTRRGLRAALGQEGLEIATKAREWILNNTDPFPHLKNSYSGVMKLAFINVLPHIELKDKRKGFVSDKTRLHLNNYLEWEQVELTSAKTSHDTGDLSRRQEQQPKQDREQENLEEGTLPTVRRFGEARFHTPFEALTLDELRTRMKNAVQKSGLQLSEVGERMGLDIADSHTRRAQVWLFLNRVANPGLFTVLRFCDAVGVSPIDLLAPPKTRK